MWWVYVFAIPVGALVFVICGFLVAILEEYPTEVLGSLFLLGFCYLIGYAILSSF